MTAHVRLAPMPAAIDGERVSVRVERICTLLDCNSSQVYRMIAAGEIEAHGIGTRGVRVYLDSLEAYRARRSIEPTGRRKKPPKALTSMASRAAHEAAMARLRERRIV
jgi:excisionase family DNA binding protein